MGSLIYSNGLPEGIPTEIFNQKVAKKELELAKTTVQTIKEYIQI